MPRKRIGVMAKNDMETLAVCRICGSEDTRRAALLKSEVDGKEYWAMKCESCRILFAHPMPDLSVDDLERIYGPTYTEEMSLDAGDHSNMHRAAIHRQMDIVERYAHKGNALNVGAMGGAVHVLEERGWNLQLVDVSRSAAERARREWGMDVTISRLEDLPPGESFDFVRLGHVIEHLPDPKLALRRIAQILRPGGILQVETDNSEGLRTRIELLVRRILGEPLAERLVRILTKKNLRKRYGRLIPPVHLHIFCPRNLIRLLEDSGFEVIVVFKPAMADPTWAPLKDMSDFSPVEQVFIRLDQVGARFGLGDLIALVARKR